jgi:hypothetical protein
VSFGPISLTGGFLGALTGIFSGDLAPRTRLPKMTSHDLVHMPRITPAFALSGNATTI